MDSQRNPARLYIIGPIFVGQTLNWLFLGALLVQLYLYHSMKEFKDKTYIRFTVYFIVFLDLVQCILTTHYAWFYMVENWDNEPALTGSFPWSSPAIPILDGLIAFVVQIAYAWRIRILSSRLYVTIVSWVIIGTAIGQCICACVGALLVASTPTFEEIEKATPAFNLWLALSFSGDVLIMACMLRLLKRAKAQAIWKASDTLLNKLMISTVQTGVVTAVVAGVVLFTLTKYPRTYYYITPAFVIGKLYSNSFLSTLNGRAFRTKNEFALTEQSSTSFPLQIAISHHHEITRDMEDSVAHDRDVNIRKPLASDSLKSSVSSNHLDLGMKRSAEEERPEVSKIV